MKKEKMSWIRKKGPTKKTFKMKEKGQKGKKIGQKWKVKNQKK